MPTDRQTVLYYAPNTLNQPGQPWYVTVEGNAIVARWNWMDATFFAPHEVSDETRAYYFTAILDDKGKWKEMDQTANKATSVGMSGGKLKIGGSSQNFIGKTSQKSAEFGLGRNNQTGQMGFVGFKFDTSVIKNAVRAYLTNSGWKKAGLFG